MINALYNDHKYDIQIPAANFIYANNEVAIYAVKTMNSEKENTSYNKLLALLDDFLSRLCGGEFAKKSVIGLFQFLSRLCGGECTVDRVNAGPSFLSRLCGGESLRVRSHASSYG